MTVEDVVRTLGRPLVLVMISSRSALGNRDRVDYCAAKAALQGMTRALAWELRPAGRTVNCVVPGHETTDMTRAMPARARLSYEQYRAAAIAVARVGTARDVAEAVAYLTSPRACFATARILDVAGTPTA